MNFADLLPVELTWINRLFYLSVAFVYVSVGHVYFECAWHRSNGIPIKGVSLANPFTPLCSFYSFSITCFRVSPLTLAPSQLSKTALWREIAAMTSRVAERFGTSYGVVWLQSSLAPGWPFTPMFPVRRNVKRTVGFKDAYGTHCCHLLSIVFRCLSVRYLCPSICWLGRSDSS